MISEILLEHAELLALLDSVQARAVVSIAPAHLFPSEAHERDTVVQRGKTSLLQRGLLQQDDEDSSRIPDTQLAAIIATVAFPKIAILLIHNDHIAGLHLFWFYQSEDTIVEHTCSKEKVHRLTVLADVSALLNRLQDILSIQRERPSETKLEIEQNAFFTVKDLAQQHELVRAQDILQSVGFSDQDATAFLNVLEQPESAGNVAFLRCADETVIDARNLAVLQDEQLAWSAWQLVPGEPLLVVETTDAPAVKEQLLSYFEELSTV